MLFNTPNYEYQVLFYYDKIKLPIYLRIYRYFMYENSVSRTTFYHSYMILNSSQNTGEMRDNSFLHCSIFTQYRLMILVNIV